mmetsp:Transcript_22889/g.29954  ORF Transcript_22889/g.29954 Transcript_22889/m.29954 type:complete len:174 (-) Transcript_22889:12-533(-)
MMDKRKAVIPNVCQAFAYLKRYIDMTTRVILPGHSVWDIKDVLNTVRTDMYMELVIRRNKVCDDDSVQEVKVVSTAVDADVVVEQEDKDNYDNDQCAKVFLAVIVNTSGNKATTVNADNQGNNCLKVSDDFVWVSLKSCYILFLYRYTKSMLFLFFLEYNKNVNLDVNVLILI